MTQPSIVLIGPTGSGKSVVGQALADMLGWPLVELDDLRDTWYPEFGLKPETEHEAMVHGGLLELIAAWKPYELLSVERVMAEYSTETVIAFGGGQSVYVDPQQIERARAALRTAGRVILLMPADRGETSLRILMDRLRHVPFVQDADDPDAFLHEFAPVLNMQLQSESMRSLATEIIISGNSTPEELARHIIATAEE